MVGVVIYTTLCAKVVGGSVTVMVVALDIISGSLEML